MGNEETRSPRHTCLGVSCLVWEQIWPLGAAFLICIVQWCIWDQFPLTGDALRELLNATISFGSVMGGFVATLMALIFAIRDTQPVKHIFQAKLLPTFKKYLLASVQMCLFLVAVCLAEIALILRGSPIVGQRNGSAKR